jgi:hypothetical protein
MWNDHGQIDSGKKFFGFKLFLSNHCNIVGHVEVLDVEVGTGKK